MIFTTHLKNDTNWTYSILEMTSLWLVGGVPLSVMFKHLRPVPPIFFDQFLDNNDCIAIQDTKGTNSKNGTVRSQ